jgi:uncharacterized protein (DUF2062 family)
VRRVRLVFLVAALTAAALAVSAGTASAQGYTGWIEHPYTSAGLWYCDWYCGQYWCQGNGGIWAPVNLDWYSATYDEMMRVYGQGVL